ncbi:50S ribosomal protein L30 [Corynebacterium uberis]|uniref:50S ribosomal protein L30 n=1 Tax=Corynebacterium TaxID=1716 RepID=UPI001D0A9F41|nr:MULTISPECIES: 50S ribosomal protein L30 [Corynebacterium]MCZ9309385.1 50S ribosomal protein L30 [Corynebacterium sp. c6VSa_13]UDL72934.1 50S ribosomal protein L30 [Corynebacterium uberis]UDL76189.1 50S ribosomal protein L30 [Corynebacterium uberis]UDL78401.1 50S ribosomal protein L30 [Corynebacterium uberis]UDL80684.1 50S ribosomal protein L30 [Corynebacterium uberis]
MALKITQVRGTVGSNPKQRANLEALGLKRIRHSVVKPDNAAVRGQINVVRHLVDVEEVAGE